MGVEEAAIQQHNRLPRLKQRQIHPQEVAVGLLRQEAVAVLLMNTTVHLLRQHRNRLFKRLKRHQQHLNQQQHRRRNLQPTRTHNRQQCQLLLKWMQLEQ